MARRQGYKCQKEHPGTNPNDSRDKGATSAARSEPSGSHYALPSPPSGRGRQGASTRAAPNQVRTASIAFFNAVMDNVRAKKSVTPLTTSVTTFTVVAVDVLIIERAVAPATS
jgi:hypothetical protein